MNHPPRSPLSMLRVFWFLVPLLIPAIAPQAGTAEVSLLAPFATANRYPITHIYGLPYPGDGSVLQSGQVEGRATVEIANTFAEETRGLPGSTEEVFFDGELYRLALAAKWGLGRGFEVGAELPFVMHRGGFLDGFIEDFHSWFGFSNGNRHKYPQDELTYRYTKNDEDLLDMTEDGEGLGDIRVFASWQFARGDSVPLRSALHASLKLPTGDSDELLGSGSTDLALSASAGWDFPLGSTRLAWYAHGGFLYMTESDVLADLQEDWVGFGTLGLGWQPLAWLSFRAQWDFHSAFYGGSEMDEIDAASSQLALGGSLGFTPDTCLDVAVGEDLAVNTAPDVIFHFSLRHLF